jgi:hypothetical protein
MYGGGDRYWAAQEAPGARPSQLLAGHCYDANYSATIKAQIWLVRPTGPKAFKAKANLRVAGRLDRASKLE